MTRCEKIILNEIVGSLAAQAMAASGGDDDDRGDGGAVNEDEEERRKEEKLKLTTATLEFASSKEKEAATARKNAGVVGMQYHQSVLQN